MTQPGQFYHSISPFSDCLFPGVLEPNSENSFLVVKYFAIATWITTLTRITKKGYARLNKSQTSTGLMLEVEGRLVETER